MERVLNAAPEHVYNNDVDRDKFDEYHNDNGHDSGRAHVDDNRGKLCFDPGNTRQ